MGTFKRTAKQVWMNRLFKRTRRAHQPRSLLLDQLERREMLIATPAYFDFGPATNIEPNYNSVTATTVYNSTSGFGFNSSSGLTNSAAGTATDGNVLRDYVQGTSVNQFFVDVANGDYDVTISAGSNGSSVNNMQVKFEGLQATTFTTASSGYFIKTFNVTVSDGQLTVGLDDLSSSNDKWYINGLTVKPHASALAPLTSLAVDFGTAASALAPGYQRGTRITSYSPAEQSFGWLGLTAAGESAGTVGADPLLTDYVSGNSTPRTFVADMVNGTYDVTVIMNSTSSPNISLRMEGTVLDTISDIAAYYKRTFRVSVSDGQFTFSVEPPSSSSYTWTLNSLAVVPAVDIPPPAPMSSGNFDFGAASSQVASGSSLVQPMSWYAPATGFGWLYYTASASGSTTTFGDPMRDDWVESTKPANFVVDVANGNYDVTVTLDTGTGTSQLKFEGLVADNITASHLYVRTYRVAVSDGQLTFNLGGSSWNLHGLSFAPAVDIPPPAPLESLKVDFGASTVASGYVGVDRNTLYSATQQYGWLYHLPTSNGSISTTDPILKDYVTSTKARTFVADMANGNYSVTVMMNSASSTSIGLRMEGALLDTTTAIYGYYVRSFPVTVSDGQFTFRIEPPVSSSYDWAINSLEIVPVSSLSATPLTSGAYDFGQVGSPVAAGYTGITIGSGYTPALQYGWQTYTPASNANTGTSANELKRDYITDGPAGTFIADVVNGTYNVSVVMGSMTTAQTNVRLTIEGAAVASFSTTAGQFFEQTYQAIITDGQLTVKAEDLDASSKRWIWNALSFVRVNAAPVAVNDSLSGTEDANVSGNLLSNDTDTDLPNDALNVSKINGNAYVAGTTISLPSGAQLSVQSNGALSYNPSTATPLQALAGGQSASDSFTYTVQDAQGAQSTATVTLSITGVNDAPFVPPSQGFSNQNLAEDAADLDISLGGHFTDVDLNGGALTYSVGSSDTSLVSASIVGNVVRLHLLPNQFGAAVITVTATDPQGATVSTPFSLAVSAVNDAPVAISWIPNVLVAQDSAPTSFNVAGHFTDVETPNSLSYAISSANPNLVTAAVDASGEVTLTWQTGSFGNTMVTVTAYDPEGASRAITFNARAWPLVPRISVLNPPTNVYEGGTHSLVLYRDGDLSQTLAISYSLGGDAAAGTDYLELPGTATFEVGQDTVIVPIAAIADYTAEADESIELTLLDGLDYEIASAAVTTLTLASVNSPGNATNIIRAFFDDKDAVEGTVNHAHAVIERDNINGPLYVTGSFISISTEANDFSYTGTFYFAPGEKYAYLDVSAASDAFSEGTELIFIWLEPSASYWIATPVTTDLQAAILDVEDTPTPLVSIQANQATLNEGDTGAFEITLSSPFLVDTNVHFRVDGAAAADTRLQGTSVLFAAGQTMATVSVLAPPDGASEGAETLRIALKGSQLYEINSAAKIATTTINDTAGNAWPTTAGVPPQLLDEDASDEVLDLASYFSDLETSSNSLVYTILSNSANSLVTPTISGDDLTLHLAANQFGTAAIKLRATDPQGGYVDAMLQVMVNSENDAPVGVADEFQTSEDAPLTTGNLLDNDTDADISDTLTITAVNENAYLVGQYINLWSGARLLVNSDGTFHYDPTTSTAHQGMGVGDTALDTFTYIIEDGAGGYSFVTVSVTVSGNNDAIVATNDGFSTSEAAAIDTGNLLTNDTDVDVGDSRVITKVNGQTSDVGSAIVLASGATLTVNSNGTFAYDPTGSRQLRALSTGATVTDSFTYTAADSSGVESTATVSIDVAGMTGAGQVVFDEDTTPNIPGLRTFFEEVFGASGGPALTYEIDTGADLSEGLFTAAIVNGQLVLTPTLNANGTGQLLLHATDGTHTASTLLDIVLVPVNDTPHVVTTIPSQTAVEDGTYSPLSLASYFGDVDLNALTFTATSSDIALADVSVVDGALELSLIENANGAATITVRATDPAGLFVETSFSLTVSPTNDTPQIVAPLSDLTLPHSSANQTRDLTLSFVDIDSDVLSFSAISSNPAVITTSVASGILTLHFVPGQSGEANVKVRATDPSGAWVEDNFLVTATGLPYISGLQLANDTGTSNTDQLTSDPTLTGVVVDDFQGATVRIEFDHEGLGAVAGFVDVPSSGTTFVYDPRLTDSVLATMNGAANVKYRVIAKDVQSAVFYQSDWQSFAFTLAQPKITILSDGQTLISGAAGLNFGATAVGMPKILPLTISNTGSADLVIDWPNTQLPAGFSLTSMPASVVAPGESILVSLQLDAATEGTPHGYLSIPSNAPADPSFRFLLWSEVLPNVFSSFGLVTDTGDSSTDLVSYLPSIAGTVSGDLGTGTAEVEFSHNYFTGTAMVDSLTGQFTYDPRQTDPGLVGYIGPFNINYRLVKRVDSVVTYAGPRMNFAMKLSEDPTVGVIRINGPRLLRDTDSPSDLYTVNPILTGDVKGAFAGGSVRVEFDHGTDGVADGFKVVSTAGDIFTYDPRDVDPAYAATSGGRTINYRQVVLDASGNVLSTGSWEAFTFQLGSPPSPQYYLSGLYLEQDTGSSSTDKITALPAVVGYVSLSDSLSVAAVQIDLNSDGVVDDALITQPGGAFRYKPAATHGSVTVRARTSNWDQNAATTIYGSWVSLTFTYVAQPAPLVSTLALKTDDGASATDGISGDPTLSGTLSGTTQSAGLRVEFDHNGDGVIDGETWSDSEGKFEYVPHGLPTGSNTLRSRTTVFDSDSGTALNSAWKTLSFTYQASGLPTIQTLALANDTGVSATDRVSTDPRLLGKLSTSAADAIISIEFDDNNNGVIDGQATVSADGVFSYLPVTVVVGANVLRARVKIWDPVGQQFMAGAWKSLNMTLQAKTNAPVSVSGLGLVNDTGTSSTDGVTADARVRGQLTNDDEIAYATIEIDTTGDSVAEQSSTAAADGSFVFDVAPPTAGAVNLKFRAREWDYSQDQFTWGPWTAFSFTYAPTQNQLPSLTSLALLSDTGTSATDGFTANPSITGYVTNDGDVAGLRVELDVNGNLGADVVLTADAAGRFVYRPTLGAYGAQTFSARVGEWNSAIGDYQYSTWTPLTFMYESQPHLAPAAHSVGLVTDTGVIGDLISTDAQIRGAIRNEGSVAGISVDVDWTGDQVADQVVTTNAYGEFTATPNAIATGVRTIHVRPRETDGATQGTLAGTWVPLTFTYNAVVNAPASVSNFALIEDTGSSPTDRITSNPAVQGTVTNLEGFSSLVVEFDHDGNGLIDGTASLDTSGQFQYFPVGLEAGVHTIRARVKEYLEGASPQFSNWQSLTLTLEQAIAATLGISNLALTQDTGASSTDRATSNAAITGTLTLPTGWTGASVEFDINSDGVADGQVASAGGAFSYLPTVPQGHVIVRARAVADDPTLTEQETPWSAIQYVYAQNPDSSESQALANALKQSTLDAQGVTTAYDAAVAQAQLDFATARAQSTSTYENNSAATTAAYNTALSAADVAYQSALAPLDVAYQAVLDAAATQFITDLSAQPGGPEQRLNFDFKGFQWPTDLPTLPAMPTTATPAPPAQVAYNGFIVNVLETLAYKTIEQAAQATFQAARIALDAAFVTATANAKGIFNSAQADAQATRNDASATAKETYEAGIAPKPGDIDMSAEQKRYSERVKNAEEKYTNDFHAVLDKWGTKRDLFFDRLHRERLLIGQNYAGDPWQGAVKDAEYSAAIQEHDHYFSLASAYEYNEVRRVRDSELVKASADLEAARIAYETVREERRVIEANKFNTAIAAAQKTYDKSVADAKLVYDKAIAAAEESRQLALTQADVTLDQAVASAKVAGWSILNSLSPSPTTAYHLAVAQHNHAYVQQVSAAAVTRDQASAAAARVRDEATAEAAKDIAYDVAADKESRDVKKSEALKTYRLAVNTQTKTRRASDNTEWKTVRLSYVEIEYDASNDQADRSLEYNRKTPQINLSRDLANITRPQGSPGPGTYEFERPFELRGKAFDEAYYPRAYSDAESAITAKNNATKQYRTKILESELALLQLKATQRATYEIAITKADHQWQVDAIESLAEVDSEAAVAHQQFVITAASAEQDYKDAEATQTKLQKIADADSLGTFRVQVADAYLTSITTWDNAQNTAWSELQKQLAIAAKTHAEGQAVNQSAYTSLTAEAQRVKDSALASSQRVLTVFAGSYDAIKTVSENSAIKQQAERLRNALDTFATFEANSEKKQDTDLASKNKGYQQQLVDDEVWRRNEITHWSIEADRWNSYRTQYVTGSPHQEARWTRADIEWRFDLISTAEYSELVADRELLQEQKKAEWDPLESTCRHASLSIL